MLYQANHVDEAKLLERCNKHSVIRVCRLLALNRSSLYRHKQVKPKQISEREQYIVQRIGVILK